MSLQGDCRDLRLDFLRGAALLVVLIDHIEDQSSIKVIRPWTLVSTCFFDGAEVFVFLSGLVFGRVFQRRMEQNGLVACQIKAVRRAFNIYLTYLLTAWIAIGIGLYFHNESTLLTARLSLNEGAGRCVLWSLPMCYQPWGFSILAMYAVILPFMPMLLYGKLRGSPAAWIVPLSLYVATQTIPALHLSIFPRWREWDFNVFAWQFLFFIGLSVGTIQPTLSKRRNADGATAHQEPRAELAQSPTARTALFLASLTILIWGLLIRNNLIETVAGTGELQATLVRCAYQWSQKTRLGPVRIIHFLSFALVLSMALPRTDAKIWRSWLLAPIIKCGQNSLAIYAFGLILMFLSIPTIHHGGESRDTILMIEFNCCALSACFAYLLEWRRHPRQPPAEGATSPADALALDETTTI